MCQLLYLRFRINKMDMVLVLMSSHARGKTDRQIHTPRPR